MTKNREQPQVETVLLQVQSLILIEFTEIVPPLYCDFKTHRFQVKVQDVVHVGGQGGEQSVVRPV